MNGEEVLRLIDSIHRDKGIAKAILFEGLEQALASAAKKRFNAAAEAEVRAEIDRQSGRIMIFEGEREVPLGDFGRIAARTMYQIMTQRIREAEGDVIFGDYEAKIGTLVSGTVQSFEHGTMVVNLGRTEAIVPRQEQVFNEQYHPGDRIRAILINVKRKGQKVSIILSRTHPNLVRELFALEVPEISDRLVEIKGLVREPGHRTKIAVASNDLKVDPVGACVGVRGTRIRNVVDEMHGERIDIIRWNESPEIFIRNALSPADQYIVTLELEKETQRARVVVPEEALSLTIGKRGQNVRLAAKLSGWSIDVFSEEEARREKERDRAEMNKLAELIEGVSQGLVDQLILTGFGTLRLIVARGLEKLAEQKGVGAELAARIYEHATRRRSELELERAAEREKRAKDAAVAAAAAAASAAAAAAAVGATKGGAAESPAAESPAAEAPVAESPAAESPAAESPAAEAPVAESPAPESATS